MKPWLLLLFLCTAFLSSLSARQILPGQVIVDNIHPHTLRRFGGGPLFICGPGDPEGFLYRGSLNSDGTRAGDQERLIAKLAEHGGNCVYLQAVRSHGGDGDGTHNPFVGNDPARGLNPAVLDQWENWFGQMEGILIYFFIYDDSSDPWRTGADVSQGERDFITGLVNRFEHHRNLIWILAEESEEALHPARARALGELIRQTDDHGHLVGNHHHSGTTFKSWAPDGPFDHYAMQLNVPLDEVHAKAIEAAREARGKYQVIWAENTEIEDSPAARRRFAWESAMGGLMPMLLQMTIADTETEHLRQCGDLSTFFVRSGFQRLTPADDLAAGATEHVLADAGRAWVVYCSALPAGGKLGVKGVSGGKYRLSWLDCVSGETHTASVSAGREAVFEKPASFGIEVALHIAAEVARPLVFPDRDWEHRTPDALGLNGEKLAAFAELAGGRGVIVRDGYLVHTWGDIARPGDLASASKPIYSHLLLAGLDRGLLKSADTPVSEYFPCLTELNPELGYKDRELSVRHLAFQTACLGYTERPGAAFDYNDPTMGLFWDLVVGKIYKAEWSQAATAVFGPLLAQPLQLQDGFHFPITGRMAGRPRMSPRDFARFGLLYLNEGMWDGKPLLEGRWARLAISDPLPLTVPRSAGRAAGSCATRSIGGGGNQTDHNGGYSWLWWLNGYARDGQRWWRDAPANMFAALGHCGQRGLAVFPDERLIVSWNDTKELHCDRELGNRAFGVLLDSVTEAP